MNSSIVFHIIQFKDNYCLWRIRRTRDFLYFEKGVFAVNRKKIIIVSVIIVCLGVAIWGVSLDRNKVIYGLSEGTYTVEGAENAIVPASITFDLNEETFFFRYDLLSSYLPHGTWEIEKGKVIATTDDKNYVYIFDIIDNDTLEFVQKGSSTITYTDENINTNPSIADGTKFIFSDPR